jgi:SAM-dependent methyltransferase
MSDESSMHDEFDTVAEWTADVACDLGAAYLVPAGCRGSGGPHTLDRLLTALDVQPADRMLDVGAGVGGPAAFAAERRGVRPVLVEPERGACRAARRMFALPTLQAGAEALPVASGAFDVAWSIGVLCTVGDQRAALAELARVITASGRIGLLGYVARQQLSEQPEGNHFPTASELAVHARSVGLRIAADFEMSAADDEPEDWRRRSDRVEDELHRRHGDDEAWKSADRQSSIMGRLIGKREVVGQLLVLTRG